VDGLLTLDLPPEEAEELVTCCRQKGLKNIFIIAPTTPESRIPKIVESASGFLYYVSREGVTGERKDLAGDLGSRVDTIRKYTDLPVVVGFGISTPEQVQKVGEVADGVVVGSALVNCISENLDQPSVISEKIGARAESLSAGLT
jgi:tryptophan synthase alpha chain